PGAARRHRARDRLRSHPAGLRRAHRRPRPGHRRRGAAAHPDAQPRARQDGGDGHPRPEGRGVRAAARAPRQGDDERGAGLRVRYLPLLWAGLFRKKTRTVLTLLSIVVAFALFGLLQAVQVAFESGADAADTMRLLTTARYSIIEPLPMSYLRRIEQVPGVVGVASADWFGAKYQNESNAFPVFAVDPARYLDMYPEFTIEPAQREAFSRTRTGAVAGKRLADRFGWKVGQKLPISSEIHAKADGSMSWEFDLVGIIDADDPAVRGNTDMVLINVAYFDEARQIGRDRHPLHELARRDQDPAREGVRAGLRQADRRHRRPGHPHPDRGVLHDPDPDRQHHGPVHPRAHPGAGDPEDPRLLRRQGHRARHRGGGAPADPRRRHRHGRGGGRDARAQRLHRRPLPAPLRRPRDLAPGRRHRGPRRPRDRPPPSPSRKPPEDRRRLVRALEANRSAHDACRYGIDLIGGERRRSSPKPPHRPIHLRELNLGMPADSRRLQARVMRALAQIAAITVMNLRNLPSRVGTSLVVVVGIAGVVGVLVSVLAMSEGFRHTLASTGRGDRVIMLRAGSDAELSSGVDRDQAVLLAALPGVARDAAGQPLASAELVV